MLDRRYKIMELQKKLLDILDNDLIAEKDEEKIRVLLFQLIQESIKMITSQKNMVPISYCVVT